ncbi:MAG: methionine--tRNA ligase [Mariprofundales bacterium]
MKKMNYFVTTPIYYVNDIPHLGHLYTTVAADVLARYQRSCGKDVFFLTGVDEHGQKVQQAAEKRGIEPSALANEVVDHYQQLWPQADISNNDFIRTSEPRHKRAVQAMWQRLQDAGAIYKGMYEDWYCVPCESYWTQTQLDAANKHAVCPDCNRPVEKVQEESYFLRLSDYQQRLLDYINAHPNFIAPTSRRNETLRFIEGGLRDLSISRNTFSWGVAVPNHEGHVVYVWIDALTNYLTADGFPDSQNYWPADVHLIGKDILRFHAVYWPCMLMAAGLPLPKRIFAHGWWKVEGQKMSKSLGNVLKPEDLINQYGSDVLRYFLLREVPFGQDGDFSHTALVQRYNTELANDFGNLLNRALSMLHKYQKGVLYTADSDLKVDFDLRSQVENMQVEVHNAIEKQAFHIALEHIHSTARAGNRYVEQTKPWVLAKQQDEQRLRIVLFHLIECVRLIAIQLWPFMPQKSALMLQQINNTSIETADTTTLLPLLKQHGCWAYLADAHKCGKAIPVFPRLDKTS